MVRAGRSLSLSFDGPILVMEDAAEYLDLEAALAASRSVAARIEVTLDEIHRAAGGTTFGQVNGEIVVDGCRRTLATPGFGRIAPLRAVGSTGQTMLAASFDGERGIVGRALADNDASAGNGASAGIFFGGGGSQDLEDLRLRVERDGDAYTPASFELQTANHAPVRARPVNRMAILRSAPQGYLRVAFGVARFEWDGREGWGLYEHALPLPALRPA
jgi:hypothetical protein